MLTDLHIKNLAIIDSLHVSFHQGLTVLTGETGAGKSIIIDAINLILGERSSADLIRAGAEEAVVEAMFDLARQPELAATLREMGIDDGGELLVRRLVSRSGRGRVFINGSLSTLAALSDLSRRMVNIYGQHESQTLLRSDNHLFLLDSFAELDGARREFGAAYDEFRSVEAEIRRIDEGERETARRMDLLAFQSGEIAEADLKPGEDEELERERRLLSHGERLYGNAQGAYEALYGGERAILDRLAEIKGMVADIAAIDAEQAPLLTSLESAIFQIEDAALTLRDYAAGIEVDPQRQQQVEDRLDQIGRLKKKYAPTIDEILAFQREVEAELALISSGEERRAGLERRLTELGGEMSRRGALLSERRREAASRLKVAMEAEIHVLAMKNAIFQISFEEQAEPRPYGMERVEFLFSPNPGEPPKPLSRIASGGELSRLMLALKQILPESSVPTLIFDEVDTGIGGATSALVGKKLKNVSRGQQVLCITHLPQVAACADHQYRVEKRVEAGRTATSVAELDESERVREMARMLGGVEITGTTLEHARELIEQGRKD